MRSKQFTLAAAVALLSVPAAAQAPATPFEGEHKGLIILVEFPGFVPTDATSDTISAIRFTDPIGTATDDETRLANVRDFYTRVANEEGFRDEATGFTQSVYDYFLAQSRGAFKLTFDVVGPYELNNNYTYYGHDGNGTASDDNLGGMVYEACNKAKRQGKMTDFTPYDWDNDGEADQVYILYAGQGQNTNGENTNLIWPQEGKLSGVGSDHAAFTMNGAKIDTYACSSELGEGGRRDGIGTICHEFTHCFGLPDTYDKGTGFGQTSIKYGTYVWDSMNMGNYLGNSFSPAGYTALERWMCGWLTPIELSGEDLMVTDLKPLSEGGDAYVIRNPAHKDEFYLIENRSQTGTDAGLYASGILITHVDYSDEAWTANNVNTTNLRYSVVAADNSWERTEDDVRGDLYPYTAADGTVNNSLTNTTKPAATTNYANADGTKFLNIQILNMQVDEDGIASFDYKAPEETAIEDVRQDADTEKTDKDVYTLDGRKVGTGTGNLRPGLYIVGGKLFSVNS